jgi:hypothetical protein
MHRTSLPLCSSGVCSLARHPGGSTRRSLRMSMSVWLTSMLLSTNGRTALSMRSSTVGGYLRCTMAGNAKASSLETFMNSTESSVPLASVAFEPANLYLEMLVEHMHDFFMMSDQQTRTSCLHHPARTPSSPREVAPWCAHPSQTLHRPRCRYRDSSDCVRGKKNQVTVRVSLAGTDYQKPSSVAACQRRSISCSSPARRRA